MRILFLTQYYPPETGAAQNRISDLAERLAVAGHEVTVLTAMPNYPTGEIFETYRGRVFAQEQLGPVQVMRTWIYATKSNSFVKRLANYFSFVLSSLLAGLLKVPRPHLVVVESPPLFLGLSGYLVSLVKRAKLVMNISDLWPASAIALGVVRNATLIRSSTAIEQFLYDHSDLVSGQARSIVEDIRKRTTTPVLLYTNGYAASAYTIVATAEASRRRFGINQRSFVVGYAGLHGLAQGLQTILCAAELLSSHSDIIFSFWGDGPEKASLRSWCEAKQLYNVRFFDPEPKEQMPSIMKAMDVFLVPLKRSDVFKGVLPNKLFESMGNGLPVIASVQGEPARLVEDSGGGIVVPPEDPEALAEAVLSLKHDPQKRTELSRRGQAFVRTNYDKGTIASRVERVYLQLVSGQVVETCALAQTPQHSDATLN